MNPALSGSGHPVKRDNRVSLGMLISSNFPVLQSRMFLCLPLRELLACRLVCRDLKSGSETRCVPLPREERILLMGPRLRGRNLPSLGSSRCTQCGASMEQASSAVLGQCVDCIARTATTPTRLFLGQLSLHRTAQVTSWLFSMVIPEVKLLRIEVQTSRGGKSRGCAWLFLANASDAAKVKSLHRRILVDSTTGVSSDGFQICGSAPKAIEKLALYADMQDHFGQRAPKPLVVEEPGRSHPPPNSPPLPPPNYRSHQQHQQQQQRQQRIPGSLVDEAIVSAAVSVTAYNYRSEVDTSISTSRSIDSLEALRLSEGGSIVRVTDRHEALISLATQDRPGRQNHPLPVLPNPSTHQDPGVWSNHPHSYHTPSLMSFSQPMPLQQQQHRQPQHGHPARHQASKQPETSSPQQRPLYVRNPYGFAAVPGGNPTK